MESHKSPTRQRILDAARQVFIRQGYKAATVREICKIADANVAAVNYHFNNKEELFLTVLETTYEKSILAYPPDLGLTKDSNDEERLFAFVRSFLLRIHSSDAYYAEVCKLLLQEMIHPTTQNERLREKFLTPLFNHLKKIISGLMDSTSHDSEIHCCAVSIFGQCNHYALFEISQTVRHNQEEIDKTVQSLARHIVDFSLAGIRQIAKNLD